MQLPADAYRGGCGGGAALSAFLRPTIGALAQLTDAAVPHKQDRRFFRLEVMAIARLRRRI
jgi:hypothetical protein